MKKRALLLDRDGIINEDYGYVGTRDRFDFKEGVFPFLRLAVNSGYRLVLVTNQAGVARGYYSQDDFKALTHYMLTVLKHEGIVFDLIQACFEHPEGEVAALRQMSFWRKPNPGMILEAAVNLNLDLSRSIMMGDKVSDAQAAQNAGVGTVLWLGGNREMDCVTNVHSFDEAAKFF